MSLFRKASMTECFDNEKKLTILRRERRISENPKQDIHKKLWHFFIVIV